MKVKELIELLQRQNLDFQEMDIQFPMFKVQGIICELKDIEAVYQNIDKNGEVVSLFVL
jgi:hypothetical protein